MQGAQGNTGADSRDLRTLLEQVSGRVPGSQDRLLELLYTELRAVAGSFFRTERPDHTLQPTALVHEAYLRLLGDDNASWQNRAHFVAVAESRAMAEVITVELRQSAKFMRNTDMKPFGRYLGMIRRIVDDGVRVGAFAPTCDARLIARAIFGAVDELALEWAMADRNTSLEEAAAKVADVFLDGLVRRP